MNKALTEPQDKSLSRRSFRLPRTLSRALRSPRILVGSLGLLFVIFVAIAPDAFTSQNPRAQNLRARLQPPAWYEQGSPEFPLGTDRLGRDIFSRTLHASRVSITVGILSVLISGAIGISLGVASGYFSGLADTIIMRIADIQLGIPPLLLVIAVAGVLGPSLQNVIIILAISSWVIYARTARGMVLSLKENEFIQGARALGATDARIILKHVLPNILIPLIVIASQQMAFMILRESTLSFLGIGVPPEIPTWGSMIADGRVVIEYAWWISLIPGLALLSTIVCINFLGDGIRDVLDQKLRM